MSQAMDRRAFEVKSQEYGGKLVPHLVAHCSKCGYNEAVPMNNHAGVLPPTAAAKLFRRRGWKVGQSRNKDACPACNTMGKADSQGTPETREAFEVVNTVQMAIEIGDLAPTDLHPDPAAEVDLAYAQLEAQHFEERHSMSKRERKKARHEEPTAIPLRLPDPEPALVKAKAPKPVFSPKTPIIKEDEMPAEAAPAPRSPERADIRRITEALDEHYEVDKGYRGDFSDQKLAEKLNVPRKWITDERVRAYGDSEGNEQQVLALAQLARLEQEAVRIERDAMGVLEKLSNELSSLKSQIVNVRERLTKPR